MFLFTTASRTALEPTQPPIQWVPGALSLGAKRPGREVDHSAPYSSKVKECVELYLHSPIRLHDDFTFTFFLLWAGFSLCVLNSSQTVVWCVTLPRAK
jgi:hypothetical protein